MSEKKPYGFELMLDLVNCDISTFTRDSLDHFFTQLCSLTKMTKVTVYFWDEDRFDPSNTDNVAGISAVCFIETSNITIHALDRLREVYINLFTCKEFDVEAATEFARSWFNPESMTSRCLYRGGYEALTDMD